MVCGKIYTNKTVHKNKQMIEKKRVHCCVTCLFFNMKLPI
jgi:hypothetical protein